MTMRIDWQSLNFGEAPAGADISALTVLDDGKIGIGTDTPTTDLHVAGSVRIVDGTQGAGKVLVSDADGNATWSTAAASGVSGSGTTGTVSKWSSTTGLTDSSIVENATGVGIGKTPTAKLDINGAIKIVDGAQGVGKVLVSDANGLGAWTSQPTYLGGSGTAGTLPKWATTTTLGNSSIVENATGVGIGKTPTAKLDINGAIKIVDGAQGAGKVLTCDANGLGAWATPASSAAFSAQTFSEDTEKSTSALAHKTQYTTTVANLSGNYLVLWSCELASDADDDTVAAEGKFTIAGVEQTVFRTPGSRAKNCYTAHSGQCFLTVSPSASRAFAFTAGSTNNFFAARMRRKKITIILIP